MSLNAPAERSPRAIARIKSEQCGSDSGQLIEQAQKEEWSPLKTIHALLGKEKENRADKAQNKRMKEAGFPYMATIEEFDFGFQRSVSKKHMLQLKELSWLESAFNILFIGPPSVGKTHLAVSLGIAAVNAGCKVIFIHMEQLIHTFRTLEVSSRSKLLMRRIAQANLLIIDEVALVFQWLGVARCTVTFNLSAKTDICNPPKLFYKKH